MCKRIILVTCIYICMTCHVRRCMQLGQVSTIKGDCHLTFKFGLNANTELRTSSVE